MDKSWKDATLFSFTSPRIILGSSIISGSIKVVCTTCYVKGTVTAELTINGSFDAGQAMKNVTKSIGAAIDNITDTTFDYLEDAIKGTFKNFADGIDLDDFDLPPLDVDFNIPIPKLPETLVRLSFDGLDVYVALNMQLSGGLTYVVNIAKPIPPMGFKVGENGNVGFNPSVDLILSAVADVDLSSGFHVKVEDGAALELALFGDSISKNTL